MKLHLNNLKRIIGFSLREIIDIFFWFKVPKGNFKKDGVATVKNFLDKELCDELKNIADKIFEDKSNLSPDSWINEREKETEGKIDTKVKAIFSFEKNSEVLEQFINSNLLQETFENELGYELVLRNCCLQYDEPDTFTKRSFHTDNNPPPSFKAFIYLTDVDDLINGPFTVIKGTHKKARYLRIKNVIYNLRNNLPTTNMDNFVPEIEETAFCGKKGDLIMSTQTLFHRGNPKHAEKTRYVLIFYFSLKKHGPYPEFNLGKTS